jgi:hypothetical protein
MSSGLAFLHGRRMPKNAAGMTVPDVGSKCPFGALRRTEAVGLDLRNEVRAVTRLDNNSPIVVTWCEVPFSELGIDRPSVNRNEQRRDDACPHCNVGRFHPRERKSVPMVPSSIWWIGITCRATKVAAGIPGCAQPNFYLLKLSVNPLPILRVACCRQPAICGTDREP